jgi:hypothetical protein
MTGSAHAASLQLVAAKTPWLVLLHDFVGALLLCVVSAERCEPSMSARPKLSLHALLQDAFTCTAMKLAGGLGAPSHCALRTGVLQCLMLCRSFYRHTLPISVGSSAVHAHH